MLNILNKKVTGLVLIILMGSAVFWQAHKEDTVSSNIETPESSEKITDKIRDILGEDEEDEAPTQNTATSTTNITTTKPASSTSTSTTTTTKPSTSNTSSSGTSTTPTTPKPSGITLTEIAKHNSRSDCWSAINGSVYDLTSWIPNHPGGEKRILILCGKDGSKDYNGAHGSKKSIFNILSGFKIGAYAS